MALWKQVFARPDFSRLQYLYNENFPLEVRFTCAEWIEQQMHEELKVDMHNDPGIDQRAANFMRSLIDQLEQTRSRLNVSNENVSMMFRIEKAIQTYSDNLCSAVNYYKHIRDTILYEGQFVQHTVPIDDYTDKEAIEINENMKNLQRSVSVIKEAQMHITNDLECFQNMENHESMNFQQIPDQHHQRRMEELNLARATLFKKIEANNHIMDLNWPQLLNYINILQQLVIGNRLSRWHRDQALAGNGARLDSIQLEEIQGWFEKLTDNILMARSTVDLLMKLEAMYTLQLNAKDRYMEITKWFERLVLSGFIVEKQPPQVMKTNTRFAATVRLLSTKVATLSPHTISVSILSESQAQQQQAHNTKALEETSGEILNNTGSLEYAQTGQLTCNLRNMQLKKIKRAEKRGTESVMDEKFALLFKSTFKTSDLEVNVWVMSLPVVVIVHGNQEPQSWATITWDNAFSEICRTPFQVVTCVQWSRMANALNTKFNKQTSRCLTNDNLYYLYEKAFRLAQAYQYDDRNISWSQFCKDPLPDRVFTFWDWFYAIMKLTRDQLQKPWYDGRIIGFISKRSAEEKLRQSAPGTFLLRFSDSEIGGITIAWVEHGMDQSIQVKMIQPFTHKDFAIRSLADRIKDLPQCVYLYPDLPKDQAFGAYYTPLGEPANNGYVKPELKVVVGDDSMQSYPNTPQRWQSPEHLPDTQSVNSQYSENIIGDEFSDFLDEEMNIISEYIM